MLDFSLCLIYYFAFFPHKHIHYVRVSQTGVRGPPEVRDDCTGGPRRYKKIIKHMHW